MGAAWAADKAAQIAVEGGDHGFFGNPETWVAVAFVLFVVLLGKILWTKVTEMLDKRSAAIAESLADAERLRSEAIAAKTAAEQTLAQATAEAEGILRHAREEVSRMQARATQNLQNAIALREQQALDRIAQAEAAASKQVRDTRGRRGPLRHPRPAARAGWRGQGSGPGRRSHRRVAATPALSSEFRIARTKQSRATCWPSPQGGGFSLDAQTLTPPGALRRRSVPRQAN